jgi:large subunit ribosomal protein L3e
MIDQIIVLLHFNHTEVNKLIVMIDTAKNTTCCKTEMDTTEKGINPLGGWVNYGLIKGDFVMIAGSCPGTKKRTVVLRQALLPHRNQHGIKIQWICTASKMGHGMFETAQDKKQFFA